MSLQGHRRQEFGIIQALNKGMNRWKFDFSPTYKKSAQKQEDLIHFPFFAIRAKKENASQREMDDGIVRGESYFGSEDLNLEPSTNSEV